MFCFLYPLAKIKFSFLNICLKSLLSFRMSLEVKVRKFSIHSPESISFIERLDPSQYVLSIMRHGLQFDLKETPPPYFEPNKQQVLYSEPVSMPSCKIGVRTFVLSVPQWVASSNNRWDPSAARIYPAFSFLPGHRHRPRTFNFQFQTWCEEEDDCSVVWQHHWGWPRFSIVSEMSHRRLWNLY